MKLGVVFKEESPKAKELASQIVEYLKGRGHTVVGEKGLEGSEFILSIGGDGTLIHKSCEFIKVGVPFVGINTGNLGFLTAIEGEKWQEAVKKLEDGEVIISERMAIEVKVGKETYRAVNEAVVKGLYRVVDLKITVDEVEFLRIVGDGVIVSAQTGSTAYSLSAGGPIVDPGLDCFLITPINSIGLPIPSVVLSPESRIVVNVLRGSDLSLVIDGQEHTRLSEGQELTILRAKERIKFGYFDKAHFLKALNAKFGLTERSAGL